MLSFFIFLVISSRYSSGPETTTTPSDGIFDSARETFHIVLLPAAAPGAQTVTASDVNVRVTTSYALKTGAGTSSTGSGAGGGAAASGLDSAHAFPNPFKPNSSLGHTDVTFTGLTPGSKVQIFTSAGEPVFEKTTPASASTFQWPAVNDNGQSLASGIYYYFITDPNGQKKKGKLAIAR